QGTVYNLCFQVLRRPEDAKDVSQQVLLKLLDALPKLSDGGHLKRWIHLVCFRESLNFRKGLRIRMDYERAKAAEAATESVPPEDAVEIHEHIASLRDDLRTLVVDHFFERKSLPELAGERRCSTVAVWKKLERAKQSLRESMTKAGISAGALFLDGFLESLRPVAPPDGLITPAIPAPPATTLPEPGSAVPTFSDAAPGKPSEPLPGRLQRFREWLMAEKPKSGDLTDAYCRKLMREWRELRPLVLQSPDVYAAF